MGTKSIAVLNACDLSDGRIVTVDAEGRSLALCRVNERVCAVDNACTHDHWTLDDAYVVDGRIVCSLHGAMFDPSTGACTRGPADTPLTTYPVEIRGGAVVVHIPDDADDEREEERA